MKLRHLPEVFLMSATIAGLLAVSGCSAIEPFPENYGQDAMNRHYQNGEMNDYQYQSGTRVFNPQVGAKGPATPAPVPPPPPAP